MKADIESLIELIYGVDITGMDGLEARECFVKLLRMEAKHAELAGEPQAEDEPSEINAKLLAACKRALEDAGELHGATRRGDIRAAIAEAEALAGKTDPPVEPDVYRAGIEWSTTNPPSQPRIIVLRNYKFAAVVEIPAEVSVRWPSQSTRKDEAR